MTAEATGTYTRTLAELAAGLKATDAPAEIRHEVGRILLDCIGCAVAGLVTPAGRIVVDFAKDEHGRLEATVVGAERASVMPAAYANTMLANTLDFDVWGPEGHMAPATVIAALAVAEAIDASGPELLASCIAGLEVGGRVGGALRRFGMRGQPQSGAGDVRGQGHVVLGVASAAGRLLGLDADQMQHALGIAGYSATVPTLRKFFSSVNHPMTKYDHLGLMAQAGIQAALLAHRGFTGDLDVLEGDIGFWRFAGAPGCDWETLTRDIGTSWVTREVAYKWYPTNHSVNNPTIALVQRMVREHGLQPVEIEHIEVRRGRAAEPPPDAIRTQMEAWTVPHYTIACGVWDVRPRRSWQEPETFRRPDLTAFMQRIELVPLREGEVKTSGNYWEHFSPIRATITARGGRTFEGAQDHMPATDDATLAAKFHENVQGFLSDGAAAQIGRACWGLETLGSARELAAGLRQDGLVSSPER